MKINQRLFDHYQIDTGKDLKIGVRCARPFDTVLIDKQGSCYACECQSWLPQSIGNLQVKSLSEILASTTRGQLQASIEDGTYRYCNEHQCSYIRSDTIHPKVSDNLRHLRLAIDDSCNLSCPSCRKQIIFHKEGSAFRSRIGLADKINQWLEGRTEQIQVHIGSDGDPFASHVYRHFMEHTPRRDHIKYSILTNGLMYREFRHRIPHVIRNLNTLSVSIDGATPATYEALRRGAKWQKLLEATEAMAEDKHANGFRLEWHMVVQRGNWREMPALLDMASSNSVDRLYFNRIQDWQTGLDFTQQKLEDSDEFRSLVREIEKHPIARVWLL